MNASETLTLRRRGRFTVRVKGPNHCGVPEPMLTVQYAVKVICANKLDKRGFLFEQRAVDEFFQSIKRTNKSCELLTSKCANKLRKIIHDENPSCDILSISVNLMPEPYLADMTYTWSKS